MSKDHRLEVNASHTPLNIISRGLPPAPFADFYHRLLKARWPQFLVFFALGFLLLNLIFALLYWLDPGGIANAAPGSFRDAFMFSVQSSATIGYGHFYPQSPYTDAIVVIEAMSAILFAAVTTGLTFAKFSRPTARVLFSNNVILTTYDGSPMLMLRLANARTNRIVEASVRVVMLKSELTKEGHNMRRIIDLQLERDVSPVFALTWTLMHRINETSPLFGMSRDDMVKANLILVVSLTGTDDTFAQAIHATCEYGSAAIVAARQFADTTSILADGTRVIDYTRFHEVEIQ